MGARAIYLFQQTDGSRQQLQRAEADFMEHPADLDDADVEAVPADDQMDDVDPEDDAQDGYEDDQLGKLSVL